MLKSLYGERRVARTQRELNAALTAHERYASGSGGIRAQLARTDLSGLCLANRTLSEADFSGASLVGASLFGSNLERASLYCADLQRCDLRQANLRRADMRGASLRGANLSFAQMDSADLRAAMMLFASPGGGLSMVDHGDTGGGIAHGVDFTNCSMKRASFGNAKLDGANFNGALLHGANFRGAKLSDASFEGAVLTGVDLRELAVPPDALKSSITDVTPAAQARSTILRDRLETHRQWIESDAKQGHPCVLDGEDIRPLQALMASRPLTGLSARKAVAIGLDFSGCQLQGARFDGADLRDADFSGADLRGASFRAAKLAHARFDKTDLRSLRLATGQMCPVDLSDAVASLEQFTGARLDAAVTDLGLRTATPA